MWNQVGKLQKVISLEELREFQQEAEEIHVHESLYEYMVTLVERTRTLELFSSGTSPRAAIALLSMSRAMALLAGRDFVTAEDIQRVLPPVLRHRVKLGSRAKAEGKTVGECMDVLLHEVRSPR